MPNNAANPTIQPLITKASGQQEAFDPLKLLRSLKEASASEAIAQLIVKDIQQHLQSGSTTHSIYRKAFKLLKTYEKETAPKYNLKRAIMALGPSGYPFERLMAEILKRQGFSTTVGISLKGACVVHEIDVFAEKDDEIILMECKFHNQSGHKNDVKIPLYIQARFQDVEHELRKNSKTKHKKISYWVATNTRFTKDALDYGRCAAMSMIGWDHPSENSLRDQIYETSLHPLTCLTSISAKVKLALLEKGMITCADILVEPTALADVGYTKIKRNRVEEEIKALFLGS